MKTKSTSWRPGKKLTVVALCLLAALFTLPIAIPEVGDYLETKLNSYRLSGLYQPEQGAASQPAASQPTMDSGAAEPAMPQVLPQLQEALAVNGDLVGWIDIASGGLSMPVTQGDDNEYYLKHDFYGKANTNGTVFMDVRNHVYPPDYNTIVYGHNVGDNMFHILESYKKLEYLKAHPTVSFDTLYEQGEYVIFSVFLASTREDQGEVFNYINRLGLKTEAEKNAYLGELVDHSLMDTGVEVTAQDRLLTLSTCSYEFEDARTVVVARRLRPGETAQSFATGAYALNQDPIMPEIWTKLYGGK